MANIKSPKKLIEVALPLDDINAEAAREKSIRHGHPSSLHLWWARRPLAAARAVLFAQLVNDPGYERHLKRGVNKDIAQKERERLFGIIRRLVKWENINNEELLNEARVEIWKSWRETCELNKGTTGFNPNQLPAFHDPFAGGGAIPFEAQRLGLESYASDLNPVAVMINKAMIEIPPRFAGFSPVNPEVQKSIVQTIDDWKGSRGLAEDVLYYSKYIRDEAFNRIGHLYPEVNLPIEYGGGKAKVLAWLWARTVKSPNPAYSHIDVPLVRSFWLSKKKGKEAWIEPVISSDKSIYNFEVRTTGTTTGEGTVSRNGGVCLLSNVPIPFPYIRNEAKAGRMGSKLMAVVVEGKKGRVYLTPTDEMESIAHQAIPSWSTDIKISHWPGRTNVVEYGLTKFVDLFTSRQLNTLITFSDLIKEVRNKIEEDAISNGLSNDQIGIENGGKGARAYSEAVSIYLTFALDKLSDLGNSLVRWEPIAQCPRQLFGRQAIPMVWDFAEPNPFSTSSGSWEVIIDGIHKAMFKVFDFVTSDKIGHSVQGEASTQDISNLKVISTDPPYYDNIGYADLSDFFYVWMRRTLQSIYPSLFATLSVPKAEELVATPHRHGSKLKAEEFFLDGMTKTMSNLAINAHHSFPITIYYAFKQSETNDMGTSSTGWETFLKAVLSANLSITGTWPLRTENGSRLVGQDSNALSSSIVLVCRRRSDEAGNISRRTFIRELNALLPEALEMIIGGKGELSPVAAVDLQQASIGPGMSVFTKYTAVLEADGSPMTVRTALQLINRVVDAYLNASDGELDAETLYCLNWFDQYGWNQSDYGQAEVLATAKGTTVEGMKTSGVLESGQGKVRLLKWQEYPTEWTPELDNRTPVWEALHQLIRALQQHGEQATGELLAGMPDLSEAVLTLAYRLYTLCERKGWADDARAYNELIASWDAIAAAAHEIGHHGTQIELF